MNKNCIVDGMNNSTMKSE